MWNWVKLAKTVALVAFVLPWLTVSCSNTVLVRASGWALASGRLTAMNPLTGAAQVEHGDINGWLAAALVVVAVGLVASFMRRRAAPVVLVTSLAALALILAGTHRFSTDLLQAEVHKRQPGAGAERFARMIRIDWQVGYWLELAALLAAAGLAGAVVAGRDRTGARALGGDGSF